MQDWGLHSDNTGGYFQCNRFVANTKVGDLAEGENEMVGNLWAEESGNAHAETMRLREKNKRMARFIHHFTRFVKPDEACHSFFVIFYPCATCVRYQAHRDSVQLEGRMFKETARRIGEGLLASKEEGGTLKWLQGYQVPHPLLEAAGEPSPVSSDKSNLRQGSALVSGEKSDGISTSAPSLTVGPTAVKKNDSHFTDATAFLKDGFEELLKCRCVSIFCIDRFIFPQPVFTFLSIFADTAMVLPICVF